MSEDVMWKPVVGYEDLYKVSDTGLVAKADRYMRGISGRMVLKRGAEKTPYFVKSLNGMAVTLSKDGKGKSILVAEIVANAFLPNPNGLRLVKHINGNTGDNSYQNLRWDGSARYSSLVKNWSKSDIAFIKKSKLHCRDLMEKFKVSKSTIYAIKNGTHKVCASVK